jgi:hypothetical protein
MKGGSFMSEVTEQNETTTTTTEADETFSPEDAMQSGIREIPVLAALAFHFDVPVSDVWARVHRYEVTRDDLHQALLSFGRACIAVAQVVSDEGVAALELHPKLRALVNARVSSVASVETETEQHHVEIKDAGEANDTTDSQ